MGPFGELLLFQWIQRLALPTWAEVQACIKDLVNHGVVVDDSKCFDLFSRLTAFLKDCGGGGDFGTLQVHQKLLRQLLQLAQPLRAPQDGSVFFTIPSRGADFPEELFLT